MQIKITMRYYCKLRKFFEKAKYEKIKNKVWQRCGEIRTLVDCWWECKIVKPLQKIFWWFFKKLKVELPYDLAISLLGVYPKEFKTGIQTNRCTCMFTAALFKISKRSKTGKWIHKMWYIHEIEYYSAIKRNKVLTHNILWTSKTSGQVKQTRLKMTTYCIIPLVRNIYNR